MTLLAIFPLKDCCVIDFHRSINVLVEANFKLWSRCVCTEESRSSTLLISKMNFVIHIFCLLITLVCSKELEKQYQRLPNAIAVAGRSFEYFLPTRDGSQQQQQQYKVCCESKEMHTYTVKWIWLNLEVSFAAVFRMSCTKGGYYFGEV